MLAEVAARASAGNVSYLELMLTPGGSEVGKVAAKAGWNDDFSKMRTAMLENGMPDAIAAANTELASATARKAELLRCGTSQAAPGCAVSVRYLYQVLRGLPQGDRVLPKCSPGSSWLTGAVQIRKWSA